MTKRQAWDRIPGPKGTGESDPAWQAFVTYREMGTERTLTAVCTQLNKSSALIGRWSARYDWSARSAAWDSHLDQQAQKRIQADDTKARADAVRRARAMQSLVVAPVNEWTRRSKASPEHLSKLKAGELAKVTRDTAAVADIGFRHEQILTGGATDRIDHTGAITIKKVDVGTVRPPIEEGT